MPPRPRPAKIQGLVLRWYARHGRDLPWRRTRDPYKILVSEVMLQQTQVDRVIPKYRLFSRTFPTVTSLARAPLRRLLLVWSGLGYNRRALHLRALAQRVVREHAGRLPTEPAVLQALPGIGPYTAGAVAVFSQRQSIGVIDTNIRRVIGRVFFGVRGAPSDRALQRQVDLAVPSTHPDRWTHGLMDIGAMICIARRPRCDVCPLRRQCRAYPAIMSAPSVRKKTSSIFHDSDRFWRGRIVALLVKHQHMTNRQLEKYLQTYGALPHIRLRRIISALVADGIVQKTRRGIFLPT